MNRKDDEMPPPRGSMDWQSQAACIGEDPALFDKLPVNHRVPSADDLVRIAEAEKICDRCSVINDCLVFAVENQESGVRAGYYLTDGRIRPYTRRARRKVAA